MTKWYAIEDDLIGGWCVMDADMPPSQATPENGVREIANFIRREDAEKIARLHNNNAIAIRIVRRQAVAQVGEQIVSIALDYTDESRDVIASVPFAASVMQLFVEKYDLDLAWERVTYGGMSDE